MIITLNIFYFSKRQKDKTQVKQVGQSSPITYISKYTIEHWYLQLPMQLVPITTDVVSSNSAQGEM